MNYGVIRKIIGKIFILLAVLMILPLIVSFIYVEGIRNYISFLIPIVSLVLLGVLLSIRKINNTKIGIREGIIIVGISWISMSLFGCIPFLVSGEIPDFFSAFFEITSGFTTTGASALTGDQIESLSHSMLFWRSFSHWIGGMGVLVFILAIIPESKDGSSVHILRAESPGPQVGKLVSKMQVTSRILYLIYIALSIIELIVLLILPDEKIGFFEALIYTFGTAGTGGFATTGASIACYLPCTQYVIAIFMIIFGINFSMFYFILIGNFKEVFKNEELRFYLIIVILSVVIICFNTYSIYNNFEETFRYSFFTVASIISTTGFANVDYLDPNATWPALSLIIICLLSVFGSCAGSTAGGMKMSRVLIITKYSGAKIRNQISPRKVEVIRMDGKVIDKPVIDSTVAFFVVFFIVLVICALLISIYNPNMPSLDPLTSFTASLACISNIGPGLGLVGPSGGFSDFSPFSKMVLSLEMIAGRLELFPILVMFYPKTWMRRV